MRTVQKIQGLFDLADGGGDCVKESVLKELVRDGLATYMLRSYQRCTPKGVALIDELTKLYTESARQNRETPSDD